MRPVLAITGRVPYSTTEEAFVQDELETLLDQGVELVVAPARARGAGPNERSQESGLSSCTVALTSVPLRHQRSPPCGLSRAPAPTARPFRRRDSVDELMAQVGGRE